uniref:Glycoprotein D n=1 Tax=Caprine alphaherpesvirus 1 TaxID=39944 RepID=Q5VJG1_9ALPH|nr:glycoprotein D [Caprine alphaherpesvirus 1]
MWALVLAALSALGALLAAPTSEPGTTVYVHPPTYPPPRYNYTEHWHVNAPVPSPFTDEPARRFEVRHVTSGSACGMLALIADAQVGRTLWGVARRQGRTYNATVAWYRIEHGCARPLYVMEYQECDPNKHFGYCRHRTPPFWASFLSGFAYTTADELGLVMAAPAKLVEGQYRRAVYIDNKATYTDFMVSLPAESCWFSRRSTDGGYTFSACFAASDYEQGRVQRMAYLLQYYPQEAHKAMVDYWYMSHGGVVPPYFEEATRYERPPAPPGRVTPTPNGPGGGEEGEGAADGDPEASRPAEEADGETPGRGPESEGEHAPGGRADASRPEGWPSLEDITRAPDPPTTPTLPPAAPLGVRVAIGAIVCAAAAAVGAYFAYTRCRRGRLAPPKKKTVPFGGVGYSALPR